MGFLRDPNMFDIRRLLTFCVLLTIVDGQDVSEQCKQDYQRFVDSKLMPDSTNNDFWAAKMSDSYGSWPQDGGTEASKFVSLGSYYSCLEIGEENKQEYRDIDFRGRYCYIRGFVGPAIETEGGTSKGIIKPYLPPFDEILGQLPPAVKAQLGVTSVGICVPSTCSQDDVEYGLLNASVKHQGHLLRMQSSPASCKSKDDQRKLDGADFAYICILCLFGALILAGTVIDVTGRCPQDETWRFKLGTFLVGFSCYSNTKKLLDTKASKDDQILCLDGIRFLSMTWVVVSHCYIYSMSVLPVANSHDQLAVLTSPFLFRAVMNGQLCVDSFFVVSGCLLGFLTFKQMDKSKGRLNIMMFYLHRYVRLTGVYAMVIGFYATLFKFFDYGPVNYSDLVVSGCKAVWWKNLVYINNFWGYETCLGQTWYLAAEFQMFLFTPVMMVPMWMLWKKKGKNWALGYGMTFEILATFCVLGLSIKREWPLSSNLATLDQFDYTTDAYMMPWFRCQPYIIGIILGFLLHATRQKKLKIHWALSFSLWLAAFALGIAVLYGIDMNEYWVTNTYPSLAASVTYNTLSKLVWALALSWLIFACFHGYGGFINDFLSWEAFKPLSRLSFVVYLIHFPTVSLLYGQFTFRVVLSQFLMTFLILFILTINILVAVVVCVTIEIPLASTDKLLFSLLLSKNTDNK